MPTVYKVLGQALSTGNTVVTLYTVPSGNSAIISTVNICNQNASSDNFRLAVVPTGESLASKHYLAFNTPIPAYDSIAVTIGITLSSQDTLRVFANTANVSFSAFGSEIS